MIEDLDQTKHNRSHYLKSRAGRLRPIHKSVCKDCPKGRFLREETVLVLNENENLCIELEQSKDIFHSIVEKSLDGIIIVDGKGVIKFTNKALCELFGKTKEELDGQLFGFPMVAGDSTEIDILHHKKRRCSTNLSDSIVLKNIFDKRIQIL